MSRTARAGEPSTSSPACLPGTPPAARSTPGRRRRWRSLRLDEAAPDRVARKLDAVAHPQLLEDVRAVALDGLLGDVQHPGDLVVGVRLGDQLHDLLLPGGEQLAGRRLSRSRALHVLA